jgi:hypothetical protein
MHSRWNDMTSPPGQRLRGAPARDGVHAIALERQLTWAEDFARAGDLASALDALGDAAALARELGRTLSDAAVDWL